MMKNSDLIIELKEMLYNIAPNLPGEIDADDHFNNDLQIDSLDLAEFVATIEQEYRIRISDEEWEKLTSFNKINSFLKSQDVYA